jgi:hypothetical protein
MDQFKSPRFSFIYSIGNLRHGAEAESAIHKSAILPD